MEISYQSTMAKNQSPPGIEPGEFTPPPPSAEYSTKDSYTVNVDCVKFEYVVLAKYHHMLIFELDLLTTQHILILCKKLL